MKTIILTSVRLVGDGLARCLNGRPGIEAVAVVDSLTALRQSLAAVDVDIVLIDVMQGVDLREVRSFAMERPHLPLVAVGLREQRHEVVRCGRAGFTGYVARDASIDNLCRTMADVAEGRFACSAEIAGSLLRALFRSDSGPASSGSAPALTRREGDVLELIGRAMSNKEIARELGVSVSTVKHHVHNVLDKLQLPGRAQAMRRLRNADWIAPTGELINGCL